MFAARRIVAVVIGDEAGVEAAAEPRQFASLKGREILSRYRTAASGPFEAHGCRHQRRRGYAPVDGINPRRRPTIRSTTRFGRLLASQCCNGIGDIV